MDRLPTSRQIKILYTSVVEMNLGIFIQHVLALRVELNPYVRRCALSRNGQIYVWSVPLDGLPQPVTKLAYPRLPKIVDVHCFYNHGVLVTETGATEHFMLSEAFGSSNSHISIAASQPCPIQPLVGMNVQRAWILPIERCYPYHCNCCIVALTTEGDLCVCSAPSNQQRWMQRMGAVFFKGLEGKLLI